MKNPFGDLIFMFFMIIFILLIVYISVFAYQKKYNPITKNVIYDKVPKNILVILEHVMKSIDTTNLPQIESSMSTIDVNFSYPQDEPPIKLNIWKPSKNSNVIHIKYIQQTKN